MGDTCEYLEEQKSKNRLADYKSRSVICDQETRRLQLLLDQKRRRSEAFNESRSSDLFFNWDEEDDLQDGEDKEEAMEWTDTKPQQPRVKDMFMLSEWMEDLPEDFDTKWMFVFCPVGKRCLVLCSKGQTKVYGKRGQRLAKFQSALPNGGQRDSTGSRYSNSGVTILDCIWSSQKKCYFVLDVLSWRGQFCMDTETSFRAFWIKSKIEESPELSERSVFNPYPFIPLNYHPCDIPTILQHISHHPYFPSDEPKLDGILFYHSQAFYTPGSTPLVLWLKAFMLPEVLNIVIPDAYEQMKPPQYKTKESFIKDFESRKKRRRRRKKPGSNAQGTSLEVTMAEEF